MAIQNWIAVASAEHARRGREGGFMQVCHGKAAPLRRMGAGDRVAYVDAHEVAILPLLDHFEFVENRQRWGYTFRFGLFAISDHDMRLIARWMAADPQSLHF